MNAGPNERAQVLQICEVFRARVVDVAPDSLMLEITGTQDKLDGLVSVLEPFGISEMVQTGAVAMTRGAQSEATRGAPSTEPSSPQDPRTFVKIKAA